jgi:hypothetical protein
MAIWRSFIAEKAMPFGDHFIAEKTMAIWICFIA